MKEAKLTEIPFEEAEYCVFDFETTGMSGRQDKVIEIGVVKILNGKIADTFSSFINPGRPIPYFITKLTGITNADVEDAPFFDEVYYRMKEFIGDSVLIAHNLSFDHSFLRHECENAELEFLTNEAVCTVRLARKLYPQFPSKSLGHLTKSLKIRHRNVHRGLGDSMATAKILLKMFPTLREEHNIDTVSDLVNFQNLPTSTKPFRIIKKKLLDDFSKIPDQPGVYFYKNTKNEIIYIGKAKSLKDRLNNYFSNNAIRKAKDIVRKASGLEFHTTNSELTALIAEAELIKTHNPKQNKMLKKYPRSYFLKLALTHYFPSVEVTSNFDFDGNDYYGPYPNRDTANILKEIVNKTFQIRECSLKEFNKGRRCYLADIERCLAPCVEKNIDEQYKNELKNINEFLCGNNQSAVGRLLTRMKELSALQKFEEAAQVRDVVQSILNQINKASILAEPINKANVLIEVSGPIKNDYMLLVDGRVIFKEYFVGSKDHFDNILEDYFTGTINTDKAIYDKDLEKLRIGLSWLVKNRGKIKVHYLNKYKSAEDLSVNFILSK
ncbi:MAG: exonuclease domain-containing protein [Ignavibacteriales bacterium]|nr:exonuclease domain-containing protein [Ignavibacteriales bacterium]